MELFVCEYSPKQRAFRVDTLERVLETNRRTAAQGLVPGYVILCVVDSSEAAHDFAAKWEAEHGS